MHTANFRWKGGTRKQSNYELSHKKSYHKILNCSYGQEKIFNRDKTVSIMFMSTGHELAYGQVIKLEKKYKTRIKKKYWTWYMPALSNYTEGDTTTFFSINSYYYCYDTIFFTTWHTLLVSRCIQTKHYYFFAEMVMDELMTDDARLCYVMFIILFCRCVRVRFPSDDDCQTIFEGIKTSH